MSRGLVQESSNVGGELLDWRGRATNALLTASVVLHAPAVLLLLAGYGPAITAVARGCAVTAYLVVAIGALRRRIDYRVRFWGMLVVGYVFAFVGIVNVPHGPVPRAILIVAPMLTMVLLGAPAGRRAAAISALILIFAPFLHGHPALVGILTNAAEPLPRSLILTQGFACTALLICPMVLLDRFHGLLMQSLANLRKEAAEKSTAHRNLEREMLQRERLEREVARVGDEERRRLGHDIHDGVCQQITGALLRCEAMVRRLDRTETVPAEELAALSSLLEEAIDEAHAVAQGLCPLEPKPEAFAAAIRTLAKRIEKTSGTACPFTVSGDVNVLDPATAQHLYRIAQEALSNAARHAHASRIGVDLHGDESRLLLKIEDNGKGICEPMLATGMGLRTMALRAQLLKGELTVTPAPAGGTRVLCCVPRPGLARSDEQRNGEGNHEH